MLEDKPTDPVRNPTAHQPRIEDLTREEYGQLPPGTFAWSRDKKMYVIKNGLHTVIGSLSLQKSNRHLEVLNNGSYLGIIFGKMANWYRNTVSPAKDGETSSAGGHYHTKIDEHMECSSKAADFGVYLKDPKTGETENTRLGGRLKVFDGHYYGETIIIPAGIGHKLVNDSGETLTVHVMTNGPHEDTDTFPCDM